MKFVKKFFKWLAITVLFLLVLMFTLPFIFKGKLVEMAKKEINKNINAKVEFGDFSLSFFSAFPFANFSMNDFSIVGLGDFEKDTLARFDRISLRVGLFSLGSDELQINSIILTEPVIKTKVLQNGEVNWEITKESTNIAPESDTPSAFKLKLNRIKIIKGEFTYEDQEMDLLTRAKNIRGELSGDMVADVANLEATLTSDDFSLSYGGINYISHASLEANGGIGTDLENSIYTFRQNHILLNNLGLILNGSIEMPADDIILDLDIKAKQNEFKNFLSMIPAVYNNQFKDIQAEGHLEMDALIRGIYNEKQTPGFELKLNVEDGMFKYPDLPGSVKNVNLALNVKNNDGNADHTIIDLQKLHLDFANNPIDARLLIVNPISDPEINGMLKGNLDLESIKNTIPFEQKELKGIISSDLKFNGKISSVENGRYEDFMASGQISAKEVMYQSNDVSAKLIIDKALLDFSPQYLELQSFDAKYGKSDFSLKGRIDNFIAYFFSDEALSGNFKLNSNLIDLNEIMAGQAENPTKSPDQPLTAFEVPSNIDFTLSSKIEKVLYDKLEIDQLNGTILLKDKKLIMEGVSMNMLDGMLIMNGSYETTDIEHPRISFNLGIQDFDVKKTAGNFQTVRLLAPIVERSLGNFSAAIENYSCALNKNMMPDLGTISMAGKIQSKNFQINDAELFNKLGEMLKISEFKSFALNDLNLSFKVKDGKVELRPFITKIKNTKTTIGGIQGLDKSIDYQMKFALPRTDFGGANQALNNLLAKAEKSGMDFQMSDLVEISASITGSITDPKITLNIGETVNKAVQAVKTELTEKIDQTKLVAIQKAEEQAAKLMNLAEVEAQKLIAVADSSAVQINKAAKTMADKVRFEGEAEAKKIEDKANGQPILLKTAAKKAADKVRVEAEKKAVKIEEEAEAKASQILLKANSEAGLLKSKAKAEGDALIEKAKGS